MKGPARLLNPGPHGKPGLHVESGHDAAQRAREKTQALRREFGVSPPHRKPSPVSTPAAETTAIEPEPGRRPLTGADWTLLVLAPLLVLVFLAPAGISQTKTDAAGDIEETSVGLEVRIQGVVWMTLTWVGVVVAAVALCYGIWRRATAARVSSGFVAVLTLLKGAGLAAVGSSATDVPGALVFFIVAASLHAAAGSSVFVLLYMTRGRATSAAPPRESDRAYS